MRLRLAALAVMAIMVRPAGATGTADLPLPADVAPERFGSPAVPVLISPTLQDP
ncbi:MAG: hypothetical protein JNL61_19155, partial [Rhizobiaceae bacterium]|nr:hypothetical protein [Rhizobiaceae bacterium]